jgi:hypothetical protein
VVVADDFVDRLAVQQRRRVFERPVELDGVLDARPIARLAEQPGEFQDFPVRELADISVGDAGLADE